MRAEESSERSFEVEVQFAAENLDKKVMLFLLLVSSA